MGPRVTWGCLGGLSSPEELEELDPKFAYRTCSVISPLSNTVPLSNIVPQKLVKKYQLRRLLLGAL